MVMMNLSLHEHGNNGMRKEGNKNLIEVVYPNDWIGLLHCTHSGFLHYYYFHHYRDSRIAIE